MRTAFGLIATAACLMLALPAPSYAESLYFGDFFWDTEQDTRARAKPRKVAHKKSTKTKPGPRVMAFEQRSEEPKAKCLEAVRVVGSQFLTEHGAEESAQKAWMEAVRYESGEQFMTLDNAQEYSRRCSRSSVGEIAGQIFFRCEVIAKPCRPSLVQGREK